MSQVVRTIWNNLSTNMDSGEDSGEDAQGYYHVTPFQKEKYMTQ
jgi:hypothetical protein